MSNFEATDTSVLQERIATLETAVEFNKSTNDRLSKLIAKNKDILNSNIYEVEDELSDWFETELTKIYEIINDKGNPLGN